LLKGAQNKLELLRSDIEAWAETSEGADFPEAELGATAG
jgi:hypothetical protein